MTSTSPAGAVPAHAHDIALPPDLTARVVLLEVAVKVLQSAAPPPVTPPIVPPTATLQQHIDATPTGGSVDLTGLSFTSGATIARAMSVIGGTVTVTADNALTVSAAGVTLTGMTLAGSGTAYAGVWGTAAGLIVNGCTITDFQYVGIMVISGDGGSIFRNTVARIGVGQPDGTNAYGIALSSLGGSQTQNVLVDGNTVADVPTWHGLDCHAGIGITFRKNVVQRCSRGMFLTSDSYGRFSSNLVVDGNQILSPAPVTYNLTPITLYHVAGVTFTGNVISGWGGQSPSATAPYYDYQGASTGIVMGPGNVVTP